ncbi:DUF1775 domain-containing protein [Streptomyces violaceus]|uniref:DUF1775 domain-containing protein n=1 Tax=Streptomyces violaceus TaxID=1936 RepID=A0ABZ1NUV6_STRVL
MSVHHAARAAGRVVAIGAIALTTTLALPTPASAHAEVQADTPRPRAENVTLTFVSEAESDSAGFTALRVVLPDGIAPDDVTLADAPKDWKLEATDDGYTVAGPALKTGVDAEHKILIRRLPDAEQLVFKTLETYSDGRIARWIELPGGDVEPEQPAPVLELSAASPAATPPDPGSSTSSTAARATGAPPRGKAAAAEKDGPFTGPVVGSVAVVLLVLVAGMWWRVKRRGSSGTG